MSSVLATLVAAALASIGSAGASTERQVPAFTTAPVRQLVAPDGVVGPAQVGPNVNVTNKNDAQSETTVAIDPTNRRHMLASSNDLGETTIIYESFDGGATWTDAGLGLGGTFCYDPWLDFNAVGDAFFAYECVGGTIQRVAYRKVGQVAWTKTNLSNAGGFPDRDMIVLDRTPSSPNYGAAYIGYDDASTNNTAYVLHSPDGFVNWDRSQKINDTSSTIGVNASVAPDGTVYAVWLDFPAKRLMVDRSTDGGETWTTDDIAHTYRLNTAQFFIFIPPQPDRGIVPMPMSDVAPAGTPCAGRLFVTYTDRRVGGTDTDVFLRYSDNDGNSWSPEIRINDDAGNAYQFHPQVAASPSGNVAVSFYDTRRDPNHQKTDRFWSVSDDCGATWRANERITSTQSDESGPGDPNDYGDYQGIDADARRAFANVWTDSRPAANQEDIFFARGR